MIINRTIVHKRIMLGSLMLSLSALPFSVKICHLGLIILFVNWVLEGDWKRKRAILANSIFLQLLTAYLLMDLVGLFFADDLATGWFTVEKKIFLLVLPAVLATTSIRLEAREIRSLLAIFVMACLAGTLYCFHHAWQEAALVIQGRHAADPYLAGSFYASLHPDASNRWLVFSYTSLAKGINIHPTYFSVFLVFCVIFLLHELPKSRTLPQRTGIVIVTLWLSVFTILLASRIVTMALLAILLVLVVKSLWRRQGSYSALGIALILVVSTLLVANPVSRYRALEEIRHSSLQVQAGANYTISTEIRYSLWWLSVESLRKWNPILGYGTGDVHKAMTTTANSLGVTNAIQSSDPHNQFLYTLLSHGVPGLALLLLILCLPLYWAWSQENLLVLAFVGLFCMLCVTESALELQKGIAFYSIFSGLLYFQLNTFHCFGSNLKLLQHVNQ